MLYVPIIGSILLTAIIVWIIVSSVVANRRQIRSALAGETHCVIPNGQMMMPEQRKSICCNAATFRAHWTADGWVASCQCCGQWQYLGDDFEHPPEDAYGFTIDMLTPGVPLEVTSDHYFRPDGELRRISEDYRPEWDQAVINARLSAAIADEEGEPLPASMSHTPNIGGEGKPEYAGRHYNSVHGVPNRFVPYDMLHDPLPGTAVISVGAAAAAGPLPLEERPDDADDLRSD